MSASRERVLLAVALMLEVAAMLAVAWFAREGAMPSRVVLALVTAFVPYAVALWAARSLDVGLVFVLSATFALGAILVVSPPALSDDLYRYLWEGRLWLNRENPYRLAPNDPSLAHLRGALWEPINNKPLASIYPPLMPGVFAVVALLGGQVATLKFMALIGLLVSVGVLGAVSEEPRAALALGLNPLVLSETALNGHFDILVGAMLLLAAWQLGRCAPGRAVLATLTAVGLKVVGVILLPLFWRRKVAFASVAAGSALLLLPLGLWRAPGDPTSGPGQFAVRWQGNDSVFALVHAALGHGFGPELAALAARVVVALSMFGLAIWVVRAKPSPLAAARVLVWGVLLLSPQVHPWYLGWLLPLEIACGGRAGLAWSVLVMMAYAPLDRWVTEQIWEMPVAWQVAEYGLLGTALWLDPRGPIRAAAAESDVS